MILKKQDTVSLVYCRKKWGFLITANTLIQILIPLQVVCFVDGKETCVMKLKPNSIFF